MTEPIQLDPIDLTAESEDPPSAGDREGINAFGASESNHGYLTNEEFAYFREKIDALLEAIEPTTAAPFLDLLNYTILGQFQVIDELLNVVNPSLVITKDEIERVTDILNDIDIILDSEVLTESQANRIADKFRELDELDFFSGQASRRYGTDEIMRNNTAARSFDTALPIAIDLDGDGVELNISGNVSFDLDGDGFREKSSWVSPDDGFLVVDLDSSGLFDGPGDGLINSHKEIVISKILNRSDITDLQALSILERGSQYGGNNDGVINSNDSLFQRIKVWQDLNQNGIVDTGEMKTLSGAGVSEIRLSYSDGTGFSDSSNDVNAFGNVFLGSASYVRNNGSLVTEGISDLALLYDTNGWRRIETDLGYEIQFEAGGKLSVAEMEGKSSPHVNLDVEALDGAIGDTRANNLIASGHSRSVQISGGDSDDIIRGGENDDMLSGDAGADEIRGGSGNDLIFFDAADLAGGKTVSGEGGIDTAYVVGSTAVNLNFLNHGFEVAYGGAGNDRLDGTGLSDNLPIFGGAGNDTVVGGDGDDNLSGDAGSDSIFAGLGDDRASGSAGNDTLNGGAGSDILSGGTENDQLDGSSGDDILLGGTGNDALYGGADDDRLDGGAGSDTLNGAEGDDVLIAGDGDDRLTFWWGDDTLQGEAGNDLFVMQQGTLPDDYYGWTVVQGGTGADTLILPFAKDAWWQVKVPGTANQWTFYHRDPNDFGKSMVISVQDIERVQFADGLTLTLSTNSNLDTTDDYVRSGHNAYDGDSVFSFNGGGRSYSSDGALNSYMGDDYIDAERMRQISNGSSGPDHEIGAYNDFIRGMSGQDTILASAGNDHVLGEFGADALRGEAGNDLLIGGSGSDQIWGDEGNDTLQGNAGSDLLSGDSGHDLIDGADGGDLATGGQGNDTLIGGAGADVLYGGIDNDLLQGGTGADRLYGVAGDDRLEGGAGADVMSGGYGNDALYGEDGFNVLSGDAGNDVMVGGNDDDLLSGGDGADTLGGGGGRDTLIGGAGADALNGGLGIIDLVSYENSAARVVVDLEVLSGADILQTASGGDAAGDALTGIEQVLGSDHNDVIQGSSIDNVLGGGKGNDILHGQDGHDDLIGGEGEDTLSGGNGDDRLWGDAGNDMIVGSWGQDTIYGGGGWDIFDFSSVTSSVAIDLTSQVHTGFAAGNLIYQVEHINAGSGDDTLRGAGGQNRIHAGDGNDLLIATLGADTLIGGTGIDRVSYENFAAGVVADLGSAASNSGGAAGDLYDSVENLTGTAYDDTLRGSELGNNLHGGAGDDRMYGGAGNDTLLGDVGDDTLDGGTGADRMGGFAGHDVYWVDNSGDVIVEGANSGIDLIYSTLGIDLDRADGIYANVENVTLTGVLDINIAGSAADNLLTGNDGANRLSGRAGDDRMYGGAGNDSLYGGDDNDVLNGGTGTDYLEGFSGNDIYHVDNAGDVIREYANGGTDHIFSSIGIDLDRADGIYVNIENVALNGASNIAALGSAVNNVLSGNDGANVLNGKDGNDSLYGRSGNDNLVGGEGNDGLWGEAGNDTLSGGADNDWFVFRRHYDQDVVIDFQDNIDTIRLLDFGFTNVAQANAYATQSGSNVVFDFGQGDTLTVRNTTINALGDDLIFA